MENQDTEFNDFMEALGADIGNQTDIDTEQSAAEEQVGDEPAAAEKEEKEGTEQSGEQEKPATSEPAKKTPDGEMFTLKVNKEERSYNREEVISLAQKGADYDRVKEQLAASRQTENDLRTKLDGQQEAMDILAEMAKASGVEIPALLDNLRIGMIQQQENVSADMAKERLLRMKAEKEAETLKAANTAKEPTAKEKAQADVAAFRKEYPDVELTQEVMDQILPGVEQGKSLAESYRDYESRKMADRIAELEEQLAAEKQNKDNRASSPGSQKDSGGKRTKDDFDDFMKAFS